MNDIGTWKSECKFLPFVLGAFFPPNLLTDSSVTLILVVQYRSGPDD
jgi:hypothetical protein